ncbi:SigE family RNA polymerase sigma factor [Actinoplanes sp. NPDC051343]|uniref:SigE family RNA polymerase sigma factor n=1 Tax=Actinoplanes sp. NPDC051343 TaxID=3363906 RepID=UPI00379A799C
MNASDEEQFREYAAARMDDLRSLAFLTCGDWQAAEDAVSTALTKLYVHWSRVTVPHRYACRVVINAAIDEKRRPWRRERATHDEALDRPTPDPSDAVGERDRLRRALREVPAGQRAVIVLRYYGDFTVEEIAEMLGRSTGTIKSQTSRGLATLRKALGGGELDGRQVAPAAQGR